METPCLGCLHGEIEPKWHHVLTQAITRSSVQDTLENFPGQQNLSTDTPPDKKHKNFHYLEGVSTELQDSFEKTNSNFRSPSNEQQTLERIRAIEKIKKFEKVSTRGEKKKFKYVISVKTNCFSEFYIYCLFQCPCSLDQ